MDKYKFRKLLKRYQNDTANETERALVEAWYDSYNHDKQIFISQEVRDRILSRVYVTIKQAHILPKRIWAPYLTIAAAFLLTFTSGIAVYFKLVIKKESVYAVLQTNAGQVKQLMLADSSVVWVNASSRIRYPQQFDGRVREIYLDNGEAFFNVKHNSSKPFIVHAQKLNVHVLGTSFNIDAYKNIPRIKVVVVTGKVGITTGNKTLAFLTSTQGLTFNKATEIFTTAPVNIKTAQSWKTGYTYLTQATFSELAGVIKNQLGVQLKPGNSRINGYRFTLRIQQSLPLDQTLQMISQIHNTRFKKEGNEAIIY